MTVKINTKDGQIELTDEVIATVVGGAATEIFGVVGMASKKALKDNFQALLGKENYSKGVVVKAAEDGSIAVDVYTVLSYGTKISEVSKNIQERTSYARPPVWGALQWLGEYGNTHGRYSVAHAWSARFS